MIDVFNTSNSAQNSQVFYAKGTTDFQVWNKPNGVKFVSIFCLGSGGGGGAGAANTASSARRGGGGGGSSGYTLGFFAASQIPDTLFLRVPSGGAGGIGGATVGTGGGGGTAYVSVAPNLSFINALLVSGNSPAGGGVGGGNGGAASPAFGGSVLSSLGFATAVAGQAGGNSGLSVAATDITPASITCGGPSGGNTTTAAPFMGGSVLGSGFLNTVTGGALGTGLSVGGHGSGGYSASLLDNTSKAQPMFFTAGGGGGASLANQGGNGGNSAFGCGGAGGGAGLTGLGGAGGFGGDGLVIITAW